MPTAAGRAVARLAGPPDVSDASLLARFIRDRDEAAFAALVRRHGPMVLGVCRRLIGDRDLAEDAFQAAFLVLARKAATVSPAAGLAGWLHGVARRAALEARTLARRRAARETPMPTVPDRPAADPDRPDPGLLARLDRAVARLPAALRAAVVLCELEGRSRREAAGLLAIPEGTLSSRLAAARRRLAAALRSSVLPAGGLTGVVSASLADRAVGAALQPDVAPARVAAVASGVCRMLAAARLKALTLCALGLAALGLVFTPSRPAEAGDPPPAKTAPAAREPQLLFWAKGKAVLLRTDGTVVRSWEGDQIPEVAAARLSPDGTRVAVLRPYETRTSKVSVPVGGGASLPGTFGRTLYKLMVCDVGERLTGPDVELPGESVYTVFWSGDGTRLYAGTHDDDLSYARLTNLHHWVIDAKTQKATELKLPAGHHLLDVSADGKVFLTQGPNPKPTVGRPIWVLPADGSEGVRLTDTTEGSYDGRLSPDGTRVLLAGVGGIAAGAKPDGSVVAGRAPAGAATWWLDVISIADGKRASVVPCKDRDYVWRACWSPDGKRVAYLPRKAGFPKIHDDLTVARADGTGAKVVLSIDHESGVCLDWR